MSLHKLIIRVSIMIVEKVFKTKIDEYFSHVDKKEENMLYVTDLVRCPLIPKYEQEYQDLAIFSTLNAATILGNFVHAGLEQFLKSHFTDVQTEVELEKDLIIEGKVIKIKGRADAIMTFNGEKIVIEIKSGRTDKGIPYEHHLTQLKTYLWMTGIKKGLLVYITSDRIAEYQVNEPLDEAELLRLVEETLKKSKTPRYPWECKYCVYSKICPIPQQSQSANQK